ncbi:MAG: SagB/ThcOx family dehydrogenase [Defluviitaleaceae bacterium]|nr:SagB/ThcOx family dehydrogenase [Defluviitaleaceae bacterium]
MSTADSRNFMKCPSFLDGMAQSDQQLGIAPPPVSKAAAGELIHLPPFDDIATQPCYASLLDIRRSVRVYDENTPTTQAQLAFMLYTAMGIQDYRGQNSAFTLRPAPSGGARHPFELYIAVQNIEGLAPGMYRYHPLAHVGEKAAAIEFLHQIDDYKTTITDMVAGQKWAAAASCVLFISCVPYRAEWRYKELAHRVALIDLGHVGQNVMLSACALGLGSCCIAAYAQDVCDKVIGLDGTEEYTVYGVTIGVPKQ